MGVVPAFPEMIQFVSDSNRERWRVFFATLGCMCALAMSVKESERAFSHLAFAMPRKEEQGKWRKFAEG